MTYEAWRQVIAIYDNTVLAAFAATVAFAINWYAWPRARTWLAIAAAVIFVLIIVIKGIADWTS